MSRTRLRVLRFNTDYPQSRRYVLRLSQRELLMLQCLIDAELADVDQASEQFTITPEQLDALKRWRHLQAYLHRLSGKAVPTVQPHRTAEEATDASAKFRFIRARSPRAARVIEALLDRIVEHARALAPNLDPADTEPDEPRRSR